MTTTKHTPTPWRIAEAAAGRFPEYPIVGADRHTVAVLKIYALDQHNGNAARIVQCVNACEGIEDPTAFIAAVRECALFWAHGKPVHAGSGVAEQVLAVFRPLFNADDICALGG